MEGMAVGRVLRCSPQSSSLAYTYKKGEKNESRTVKRKCSRSRI